MRTTATRKTAEARFADSCKVLKTKTTRSSLRTMSAIYSGIHEKISYSETVRFSVLFLQMQTLFSGRADEALDTRDADRDTVLHMWNYTLCTDMR